ncbi:MAG: hypothetical protein J6U13_02780 [Salinivirgaceae bacterium]|nr:hypothetical protein [Salinivirgaceae bacterium]
MKKSLLLVLLIVSIDVSAQIDKNLVPTEFDGSIQMSDELKGAYMEYSFYAASLKVDSLIEKGMYMSALETTDSLLIIWKNNTKKQPPIDLYMSKCKVLSYLEEWNDLIETTKECLTFYNNETKLYTSVLYSMQGFAYRSVKDYNNAVRAYEASMSYSKNDIGNEANMLCNMAYCYESIGKSTLAGTLYNKGFNKYLEYFKISRTDLLKNKVSVTSSFKETALGVFGCHLYNMAVFEQNYGTKVLSKEYLLMSANCGNEEAQSEYDRIYGGY